MKRLIQELFCGALGSAIGLWLIAEFHWVFLRNFQATCKDHVFAGFLVGLPLGAILGLWILHRFVYRDKGLVIMGVILGLVLSFVIEIVCICLIPVFGMFGMFGLLIIPPLAVSMAFVFSQRVVAKLKKQ